MTQDKLKETIIKEIDEYKTFSKNDIEKKLYCLNLIIQLESKHSEYKDLIYKHIKIWLRLYIKSSENKKFSYDDILYEKVIEKINLLKLEERVKMLTFFIRLLKSNLNEENIDEYEKYKKELELKILFLERKYLLYFLKTSIHSSLNLLISLLLSLVIFSFFLMFLENKDYIDIELNSYSCHLFLNYTFNLIGNVFEIGEPLKIDNTYEFLLFTVVKLYFYIFITYFIVKKIFGKLEK